MFLKAYCNFTDDDIKRIKDASASHLIDVVQDFQNLRKSGTSYICDCPVCKASKKFSIHPVKDIYGCFSCHQVNGVGALDKDSKSSFGYEASSKKYWKNSFTQRTAALTKLF